MTSVVTTRRSARVKVDRGVRRETITIHQGADALELEVRLYRVKRVIVLREIGERDALSAVSLIEEIVLELMGRYGEAMDEARIFLYQPVQMWTTRSRYLEWRRAIRAIDGWSSVPRADVVELSEDHSLPK